MHQNDFLLSGVSVILFLIEMVLPNQRWLVYEVSGDKTKPDELKSKQELIQELKELKKTLKNHGIMTDETKERVNGIS